MEEMRLLLSYGLLGTFLLLSHYSHPSHSLSDSDDHFSFNSRRLLKKTHPKSTIQQYLTPHNIIRAKLGLPPLKWSKKVASFANYWAHQRQGDCGLIHSNTDYGENLFWGSGKDWTPRDAVQAWASEKGFYNYKTNTCKSNKDCLHYTQMVWRQSLKVGCARVTCRSGDTLISCNYDPHGNVIGQKPF